MLLLTVTSWLDQREREVLAYLIEENRVLRRQWVDGASDSPMTTGGSLPRERTGWAVRPCMRSRRSSRRTRCSDGTGNSSSGNGRTPSTEKLVAVWSQKSA